jgi:hypothetical protein
MQPDNTEVCALSIPTDVHHPNPQSSLIQITTRQTDKEARAGRRTKSLIHRPDVDGSADGGEGSLLVVWKRRGDQSTRTRRPPLYKEEASWDKKNTSKQRERTRRRQERSSKRRTRCTTIGLRNAEGRRVGVDEHVGDRGGDTGGRTYKETKKAAADIDGREGEMKRAEEKAGDEMG